MLLKVKIRTIKLFVKNYHCAIVRLFEMTMIRMSSLFSVHCSKGLMMLIASWIVGDMAYSSHDPKVIHELVRDFCRNDNYAAIVWHNLNDDMQNESNEVSSTRIAGTLVVTVIPSAMLK